jgi:hypothetical protein
MTYFYAWLNLTVLKLVNAALADAIFTEKWFPYIVLEIFISLKIHIVVLWVVTPCSSSCSCQRVGGTQCVSVQVFEGFYACFLLVAWHILPP